MSNWDDCKGFTTICRLCLHRDGFMLGIFNRIQGMEKSIYKKIIDCTSLKVCKVSIHNAIKQTEFSQRPLNFFKLT